MNKLLAAFRVPEYGSVRIPPYSHTLTLVEPLSDRELDVLRFLAEHRTNQEIAQAMCVSVNTVKTHLKNVYGKLGVHSRKRAVTRAKELGLL